MSLTDIYKFKLFLLDYANPMFRVHMSIPQGITQRLVKRGKKGWK